MVMNSRRAQNEISANRITVTPWPSRKAAARVANKIHQARTRRAEGLENRRVDAAFGTAFQQLTVPKTDAQEHQHGADQP